VFTCVCLCVSVCLCVFPCFILLHTHTHTHTHARDCTEKDLTCPHPACRKQIADEISVLGQTVGYDFYQKFLLFRAFQYKPTDKHETILSVVHVYVFVCKKDTSIACVCGGVFICVCLCVQSVPHSQMRSGCYINGLGKSKRKRTCFMLLDTSTHVHSR
jgi:hypothetical protein